MSVDIFGRSQSGRVTRGPPGVGFSLTESKDFDLKQKRLCNLGEAIENSDAVNLNVLERSNSLQELLLKKYIDDKIDTWATQFNKQYHEKYVLKNELEDILLEVDSGLEDSFLELKADFDRVSQKVELLDQVLQTIMSSRT